MPPMNIRTHTIFFLVLVACLSYGAYGANGALYYLQQINLTFIQIRCVVRSDFFSPTRSVPLAVK